MKMPANKFLQGHAVTTLLSCLLLASSSAVASYVQVGDKYTQGGIFNLGSSCALDKTGGTLIVGGRKSVVQNSLWYYAPNASENNTYNLQQTFEFAGISYAYSASISGDGNTLIVGDSASATANIFNKTNGQFVLMNVFSLPGQIAFGSAVAISGDGNTAVIGNPMESNRLGATYVYTRGTNGFAYHTRFVGSKALKPGPQGIQQGSAVAINCAGDVVVVGGPGDTKNTGAAWVFMKISGVWKDLGKLSGKAGSELGASVSVNCAGTVVLVGAPGFYNYLGAVFAYIYSPKFKRFLQQKPMFSSQTPSVGEQQFGYTIALDANGTRAIIGATYDTNERGAAYIFQLTAGKWQKISRLEGSNLQGGSVGQILQGACVAISANAEVAVVGGTYDDNSAGAFWVYEEQ